MRAVLGGLALAAVMGLSLGPRAVADGPDERPPWQRLLTGADAARVAALEKQILPLTGTGKFAEAVPLRKEVWEVRRRAQGERHWQTVDAWWQYRTCQVAAERPEAERKEFVGAFRLAAAARKALDQRKYDQAEKLYRQLLAALQRLPGEDFPETATAYHNVAFCLQEQGRYAEAQPLMEKAHAVALGTLGEDHPDTARALDNLAQNLQFQGRLADAQSLFEKALKVRRAVLGEDDPNTTLSYNNLAANLGFQGRYAEAEPLLIRALAAGRRQLKPNDPELATLYGNLGYNLDGQGRYAEARPLYEKALQISRDARGEEDHGTAVAYSNLAHNLDMLDEAAAAGRMYEKALAAFQKSRGEDHPQTAVAHDNLAVHLMKQKQPDAAQEHAEAALAIRRRVLGDDHPDTGRSYHNLAGILAERGRHAEAYDLAVKGLRILRDTLGDEHPQTALARRELAGPLIALGRYGEAEEQLSEAARAFERLRLQVSLTGLDRSAYAAEQSPLPALAAMLARRGQSREAWQQLEGHFARGLLDDASRPLDDAERASEQKMLWRMSQLDEEIPLLLGPDGDRPRAAKLRQERDGLQQELSQFRGEMVKKYGVSAGAVFDLKRIQSALPANAALLAYLDVNVPPQTADPRGESWACVVRSHGEPAWVRVNGSGPGGAWTDEDTALPEKVMRLLRDDPGADLEGWHELTRRLAELRLSPVEPLLAATDDLPAVRHLIVLPSPFLDGVPVEALLAARHGENPPYGVSYAPSGTMLAWLRDEQKWPVATTRESHKLLALGNPDFRRPPPDPPEPPAKGLFVVRVEPGGNGDRSGIKPHDVLLTYAGVELTRPEDLQTAVRPTSEGQQVVRLWRDGRTLDVSVGGGFLKVETSRQSPAEALRGALEAEATSRGLPGRFHQPLPYTAYEVKAIAHLFPNPVTLLGRDASEESLSRLAAGDELRSFWVLHLATHGEADARAGLRSAVILSDEGLPPPLERVLGDKEVFTGRLTAERILRTWRLDADLVTLSACETGLGRYAEGEGYLGFAQALFLAGARTLVLSQWKVRDDATALLMLRFYQNLLGRRPGLNGPLPKAVALAEAKRWLSALSLRDAIRLDRELRGEPAPASYPPGADDRRPFRHPHFWAGFLLAGDPGDVTVQPPDAAPVEPGTLPWIIPVLGCVLAFLGAGAAYWLARRRKQSARGSLA